LPNNEKWIFGCGHACFIAKLHTSFGEFERILFYDKLYAVVRSHTHDHALGDVRRFEKTRTYLLY